MNTLRDNMKDLVKELLRNRGIGNEFTVNEWAGDIADRLGLLGPEGDKIGRLPCVIVTTLKCTTTLYHKPEGLPMIWIDFDRLRNEGTDSVEVF